MAILFRTLSPHGGLAGCVVSSFERGNPEALFEVENENLRPLNGYCWKAIQIGRKDRLPASCPDHPIWMALADYSIGPEGAKLSFAGRLARENGWSDAHAARVIGEYRRFCFLAATAGHEVTPSDAVDQAWHLHLTYSRDYWERFCPSVLGRPLHHCPTAGGGEEQHRHFEQYAETLRTYARVFGESAPPDLWPNAAQRLIEDPKARRVHPRDGLIISKQQAMVIGLLAAAIFIAHVLFW